MLTNSCQWWHSWQGFLNWTAEEGLSALRTLRTTLYCYTAIGKNRQCQQVTKYCIMTQKSHTFCFIEYCSFRSGLPSSTWAVFPAHWLPELHFLSQPTVWMVHSWTEVLSAIPVPELHRDYAMGWRRRWVHQQCLLSYPVYPWDRPECKYVTALLCIYVDLWPSYFWYNFAPLQLSWMPSMYVDVFHWGGHFLCMPI